MDFHGVHVCIVDAHKNRKSVHCRETMVKLSASGSLALMGLVVQNTAVAILLSVSFRPGANPQQNHCCFRRGGLQAFDMLTCHWISFQMRVFACSRFHESTGLPLCSILAVRGTE